MTLINWLRQHNRESQPVPEAEKNLLQNNLLCRCNCFSYFERNKNQMHAGKRVGGKKNDDEKNNWNEKRNQRIAFFHLARLFDSFAIRFHPTECAAIIANSKLAFFMAQCFGITASWDSRHRDDTNIFLLTRNFTARVY